MASKSLIKKDSRAKPTKTARRVQDATPANQLEIAIGEQVRAFRKQLHMTVAEVANQADLSPGMLSKIENGLTSPSLATLKALSGALNVPVTAFFRKYEEERDATFVKAGQGARNPCRTRTSRIFATWFNFYFPRSPFFILWLYSTYYF